MLEENIVVEKKEAVEYPPLPKDVYSVQLLDISSELRATYDTRFKPDNEQEKENVLNFQFTLLEGKDTEGKDLRVRNVWANFIPTYLYVSPKGKNKLFKIIEALLGRELTREDEAKGIDSAFLNALVGKHCRISVEPKPNADGSKTYDNIIDWMTSKEEYPPLTDEEKETARVKTKEEKEESQEDTPTPPAPPSDTENFDDAPPPEDDGFNQT